MPEKHEKDENRFAGNMKADKLKIRFPWEEPSKRADDDEEPIKERLTKTLQAERRRKKNKR